MYTISKCDSVLHNTTWQVVGWTPLFKAMCSLHLHVRQSAWHPNSEDHNLKKYCTLFYRCKTLHSEFHICFYHIHFQDTLIQKQIKMLMKVYLTFKNIDPII